MLICRRTRLFAVIALACGGALAFTGCANPIESLLQEGSEGSIEKILENEGIDVDLDSDGMSIQNKDGSSVDFGTNASVPSNWPGLPVPKGDIIASTGGGNEAMIMVATTQQEVDSLAKSLESDGFAVENDSSIGEMSTIQLAKGEVRVILGMLPDTESGKVNLQYLVTGL